MYRAWVRGRMVLKVRLGVRQRIVGYVWWCGVRKHRRVCATILGGIPGGLMRACEGGTAIPCVLMRACEGGTAIPCGLMRACEGGTAIPCGIMRAGEGGTAKNHYT